MLIRSRIRNLSKWELKEHSTVTPDTELSLINLPAVPKFKIQTFANLHRRGKLKKLVSDKLIWVRLFENHFPNVELPNQQIDRNIFSSYYKQKVTFNSEISSLRGKIG